MRELLFYYFLPSPKIVFRVVFFQGQNRFRKCVRYGGHGIYMVSIYSSLLMYNAELFHIGDETMQLCHQNTLTLASIFTVFIF